MEPRARSPHAESEPTAEEPHAEGEAAPHGEPESAHAEPTAEGEPKAEGEPDAEHTNNVVIAEPEPAPIDTTEEEDEELNAIFHPKAGHNKRKANGASMPVASSLLALGALVVLRR